jgi:hypothetical protein
MAFERLLLDERHAARVEQIRDARDAGDVPNASDTAASAAPPPSDAAIASGEGEPMFHIPAVTWGQPSPALRDLFLNALDGRDRAAIEASARNVHGCAFSLPGATCVLLGLAPGSTYGDAAAMIAASNGHPFDRG